MAVAGVGVCSDAIPSFALCARLLSHLVLFCLISLHLVPGFSLLWLVLLSSDGPHPPYSGVGASFGHLPWGMIEESMSSKLQMHPRVNFCHRRVGKTSKLCFWP